MRRSMFVSCLAMAASLLFVGAAEAAEPRTPGEPRKPRSAQPEEPESRPAMSNGFVSLGGLGSDTSGDVHVDRGPRNDRASSSSLERTQSFSRPPWTARRFRPSSSESVQHRIAAAWPGDNRDAVRVAACESSLNPSATSRSGRYSGLFQFDSTTWRSVGGSGSPAQASVEEQTRRAWRLKQSRGWAPWPNCGSV